MIKISVIVDGMFGIGKDNKLLAHIPNDLKYFKNLTKGQTVLMGYNTYLSLPNKPLVDRVNIVLTSKKIELPGVIVLNSIEEVLKYYELNIKGKVDLFIIGGASIYKQFLEHTDRLYITHILEEFEADTFFPNIYDWEMISIFGNEESLKYKHKHLFTIYEKK